MRASAELVIAGFLVFMTVLKLGNLQLVIQIYVQQYISDLEVFVIYYLSIII